MTTPEGIHSGLFAPPVAGVSVSIGWRHGLGWSLWINSWTEGQAARDGDKARYDRLTAAELVDVLECEIRRRCDWL